MLLSARRIECDEQRATGNWLPHINVGSCTAHRVWSDSEFVLLLESFELRTKRVLSRPPVPIPVLHTVTNQPLDVFAKVKGTSRISSSVTVTRY